MTDTPNPAMRPRPLSPHLQVYKPQITSVMSILHRITGLVLYAGMFLIAWWLFAKSDPSITCLSCFEKLSSTLPAKLIMLAWAGALYYHLYNGIRHLYWDAGIGLNMKALNRSGWTVLLATALTVAYTACQVFGVKGF